MDKIKCPECEGEGFILDHEEDCDGNCVDCPRQIQCPNLNCEDGWVEN